MPHPGCQQCNFSKKASCRSLFYFSLQVISAGCGPLRWRSAKIALAWSWLESELPRLGDAVECGGARLCGCYAIDVMMSVMRQKSFFFHAASCKVPVGLLPQQTNVEGPSELLKCSQTRWWRDFRPHANSLEPNPLSLRPGSRSVWQLLTHNETVERQTGSRRFCNCYLTVQVGTFSVCLCLTFTPKPETYTQSFIVPALLTSPDVTLSIFNS